MGFDNENTTKKNLPIVSGCTVATLKNGEEVILRANELVYNDSGPTLLSTYQVQDYGIKVDDVALHHGGTSSVVVDEDTILP